MPGPRAVEHLISLAREASFKAQNTTKRSEAKDHAARGIAYADQCVSKYPREAACLYYRAVNTGLYYRAHIVGYQAGVKRMIADCERALILDSAYDHGGPHRLLGELYTKLPETSGRADGITRDLAKAKMHLEKALALAPKYPENHLVLAEALFAEENYNEAWAALERAKALAPGWQTDSSYRDWQLITKRLEARIAKRLN